MFRSFRYGFSMHYTGKLVWEQVDVDKIIKQKQIFGMYDCVLGQTVNV